MASSTSVGYAAEVDFQKDVRPILQQHCADCHAAKERKGGFSINTRQSLLEGGESGPALVVGQSQKSLLVELITETDPDLRMPLESRALSAEQVTVLKRWIDQGAKWPEDFAFGPVHRQAPLAPREVTLPPATADASHPIDRLLAGYYAEKTVTLGPVVGDRLYARRVYLDLVGLLPAVEELDAFVAQDDPNKREALVENLLSRKQDFAEHWLTPWSDMLRNAYRGTGFIDGGRSRIDGWLYQSLYDNKSYDKFVHELVSGTNGSAGFINGIKWRGNVNESQRREMQAAQSVAQVFMGTNLKCASCHDSFVNHWKLADSYALASVFAEKPLELHRCDKPTGKAATVGFIYPKLGTIDATAPRAEKMKQLANLVVQSQNGRLARTIVNRIWARFMGHGIIEPIDDMDQLAFSDDLLDWLANDLAEHNYDLKRTMQLICTSRAYQSKAQGVPRPGQDTFVFRGPVVRRMNAEMFSDAISRLTNKWPEKPVANISATNKDSSRQTSHVRAALVHDDPLTRALGRPNREQVVTRRESVATTMQVIELTNGKALDDKLKAGAEFWLKQSSGSSTKLVDSIYLAALGRSPNDEERAVAVGLVGESAKPEGVADLLWTLTMLPEFQLIR